MRLRTRHAHPGLPSAASLRAASSPRAGFGLTRMRALKCCFGRFDFGATLDPIEIELTEKEVAADLFSGRDDG